MQVTVAKTAGFCFGVRRALELTQKSAALSPTCTLGELIHNRQVVEELAGQGVAVIERPEDAPAGAAVVIRSHGVGPQVYDTLRAQGSPVIDATCPFVKRIHQIAAEVPEDGLLLLAGRREHPEVQGILGYCRGQALVFSSAEEMQELLAFLPSDGNIPVILAAQTTFSLREWEKILFFAKKVCTNLKVFDTICRATIERQSEAETLAQSADAIIVVGGRHSANTTALAALCGRICPTVQVETAAELCRHREVLRDAHFIGITAGASTPACIIKEVQNSMSVLENNTEEMNFGELLDQYSKSIHNGEKVTAVVTGIKPTEISVDAGTKHACYVPLDQLTSDPSAKPEDIVKIGDELELMVVRVNDVEGTAMLSKTRLDAVAGFEKVMNAGETGEVLTGVVTEVIKGGVLVLTNGVKVFIPASQTGVPRDGDLNTLLRKEVSFKILETNRQRRRAVGSISVVAREARKELAQKFWDEVEVGKVYTGKVKSLTNFGAFVDLGGVDGRIGLTDLTWLRVKSPAEVVSIGDTVEVTVKDIDRENNRVSLIYKKTEDNPWEKIKTMYQVGDVVPVKIMSLTTFGAFAQIIPGIDGLIHISQIARERVEKVADKLSVGQVVDAKITELDYDRHRASLSIKALLTEEAPEEEAAEEETPAEE